jgi:hypothetical protein
VADVSKVKSELIKTRRIVFTPNTQLKKELAETAIQITCYDRNGDVVKRVTTTSGDVVTEPDTDTSTDTDTNPQNSDNTNTDNTNTDNTSSGGNGNGGGTTGGSGNGDE